MMDDLTTSLHAKPRLERPLSYPASVYCSSNPIHSSRAEEWWPAGFHVSLERKTRPVSTRRHSVERTSPPLCRYTVNPDHLKPSLPKCNQLCCGPNYLITYSPNFMKTCGSAHNFFSYAAHKQTNKLSNSTDRQQWKQYPQQRWQNRETHAKIYS